MAQTRTPIPQNRIFRQIFRERFNRAGALWHRWWASHPGWQALALLLVLDLFLNLPTLFFYREPLPWDWSALRWWEYLWALPWYGIQYVYLRDVIWLSLDLLICVSLILIFRRFTPGALNWTKPIVAWLLGVWLAYELYDSVILLAYSRSGLLYNDIFLLPDVYILFTDLSVIYKIGILAILGLALILFVAVIPKMWSSSVRTLNEVLANRVSAKRWYLGVSIIWLYILISQIDHSPAIRDNISSTTARMVVNGIESVRLHRTIVDLQDIPADSSYFRFQEVPFTRRPNIYLLIVESYGEVVARHPEIQPEFELFLTRLADSLKQDGWYSATAYSVSPVEGGFSRLATGSVLTGMSISNEIYYNLLDQFSGPTLVNTLQAQEYHTITLQPNYRPRVGRSAVNLYHFDTEIYFNDLGYQGPHYGWGIVPDQYSLGFTHENFLSQSDQPFFLYFAAVSSHIPWERPPPLVADWRALNQLSGASTPNPIGHSLRLNAKKWQQILDREPEPFSPVQYLETLLYDWEVFYHYIRDAAPANSLFIIMGDHQPPFLNPTPEERATPVHIISRDSLVIQKLMAYGFSAGLWRSIDVAFPEWHHAGLFSLFLSLMTDSTRHVINPLDYTPGVTPANLSRFRTP
ncbi:MAG: hypothetical protein K9N11_01065 [Lentisphaeria bacterium]|nr:hypothetical protein [Candidatus Neomarinimicrobiota bacterium]MCF7841417.1 hypothetical protein [Lentisphaeria bacterium]